MKSKSTKQSLRNIKYLEITTNPKPCNSHKYQLPRIDYYGIRAIFCSKSLVHVVQTMVCSAYILCFIVRSFVLHCTVVVCYVCNEHCVTMGEGVRTLWPNGSRAYYYSRLLLLFEVAFTSRIVPVCLCASLCILI